MCSRKHPYCLLFFVPFLIFLESCTRKAAVLVAFVGDREHRDAAMFLAEQADGHYGLRTRFKNERTDDLNEIINNYLGEADIVDSLSAISVIDTLWDGDQLTKRAIIENTRLAFRHYRENPLNMEVPDSVFYEYILPYRAGRETIDNRTGNWRLHFNKMYNAYLQSFDGEKDEAFINSMVTEIQQLSFHVYDRTGLARYGRLSPDPSFDEIRKVAHPYSCEDYALFKLYSYRSLGLAAAYEVVPLYGKFNHGHAEATLFHRDGTFHCTEGTTEMPYKYQIAKMYRRRFSKRESPRQKILSLGEREENIPAYFDMPYQDDVTKERTIVSDVAVPHGRLRDENVRNVLYICVYNDGEWKPVEWANRDAEDGRWIFKDMGRKILYHLSAYEDGFQQLVGDPFVLDSIGDVRHIDVPRDGKSMQVTVRQYDRNKNISEGNFRLYTWEAGHKNWQKRGVFSTDGNELRLSLSENTLYRIEKDRINTRPFSIADGRQIWW